MTSEDSSFSDKRSYQQRRHQRVRGNNNLEEKLISVRVFVKAELNPNPRGSRRQGVSVELT